MERSYLNLRPAVLLDGEGSDVGVLAGPGMMNQSEETPDAANIRMARLAKKADSARKARLRHKGDVHELQTTLRRLMLQAFELQSQRQNEESAYFQALLDQVATALPIEERNVFTGWLDAQRIRDRVPSAPATADEMWEPELVCSAYHDHPVDFVHAIT